MNSHEEGFSIRRDNIYDMFALIALAAAIIALYISTPKGDDFWWYDAPRHALNGVFIRDLLADLPLHDPVGYAVNYYLHYPALTIMLYPPLLYVISAPFYALFGISQTTALAPVFLLYFALAVGTYALSRRWLDRMPALGAALALAGTPVVALWGRQVMLDIPCYAFLVWSVWCFFRYTDRGQPLLLYAAAFLLLCAIYTKLNAVFMAPILVLGLLLYGGLRVLKVGHVWAVAGLFAVGLIPLAIMTVQFGQVNVQNNLMGLTAINPGQSAFTGSAVADGLFYPMHMPGQLGWPTLLLAAAFLTGAAVLPRWRLPWRDAVLLGCWLLFGYLFFTAIAVKEPRHDLLILFPVVLMAVLFLDRVLPRRLGAVAAVAFGTAVMAATLIWDPVPYMGGYREAARYVAEHAPEDSIVMFSGHRDGNFIFAMRGQEQRRDLAVLRATKLLLRYSIGREFGVEEMSYTEDEIARMINTYGAYYVVAETDFWMDLAPMARLQAVLRSPQFEVVKRIPVVSNVTDDVRVSDDARELVIYRNRGPVAESGVRLSIELLGIGRRFEGTVN